MPESLAVRRSCMSATITRVHEVLDAFAARDHSGEILTAVRHFPARDAQWADFPAWVHADLASCYAAKGIRRLYIHQAAAAETVHAGKNAVIVTPTASGKNAVLQPAGVERGPREFRHPRALPLPHQSA